LAAGRFRSAFLREKGLGCQEGVFGLRRVQIYLKRNHRKKDMGHKAYPSKYLYEALKLYRIPTTAPWTQAVKAAGRR